MTLVVEHATEAEATSSAMKTEIVARLHARYDRAFGAPAVEAVAVPVVDELLQEARILTFLPLLADRVTRHCLRHTFCPRPSRGRGPSASGPGRARPTSADRDPPATLA